MAGRPGQRHHRCRCFSVPLCGPLWAVLTLAKATLQRRCVVARTGGRGEGCSQERQTGLGDGGAGAMYRGPAPLWTQALRSTGHRWKQRGSKTKELGEGTLKGSGTRVGRRPLSVGAAAWGLASSSFVSFLYGFLCARKGGSGSRDAPFGAFRSGSAACHSTGLLGRCG